MGQEDSRERLAPAKMWMRRSNDSLCEDEVDEEEEQYPGGDEDACRDRNAHVVRPACPDNPHDHSGDSCHAEAEREA